MPTVVFVDSDDNRKEVSVDVGYTVMEAAVNNGVDAILAECGGACACATCHGYIDAAWVDKLPEMDDMPTVVFVDSDDNRKEVSVDVGYTVMEAAVNNGVDAILAECGGACACATCHGYIDAAWVDKLPEMDDMEDSMLDAAYERKDNSRLTCQIEMTDELDGLVVHVAQNDM
ncbi:MAG: 2Fe-2S iron-sulfur cluster-binding protein [Pseudomonadota bacterium]